MIKKAIGILGGTFDPVHNGHLQLARSMRDELRLDEVRLLPCHVPALKPQPIATPAQRVEMLKLAINSEPALSVDERELHRDGPSYMVDTLQSLRDEVGPEYAICLIVGMDAFLSLPAWHNWQEIIKLAHLIVVQRPGYDMPTDGEMASFYLAHQAPSKNSSKTQPAGKIYVHEGALLDVSASQVRLKISQREPIHYLLPDVIWDYIAVHGLYQSNH